MEAPSSPAFPQAYPGDIDRGFFPVASKRKSKRQGVPVLVRKPRVPALAALAASPGTKGAGVHGKSKRAQRRADKMALVRTLATDPEGER